MSSTFDSTHPTTTGGREVAFVDIRAGDIVPLLQQLGSPVEIVRTDAGRDGLAQMAAALGERGGVAAGTEFT